MTQQDTNKNLKFTNSICSCIEFTGDGCVDFLNNLLISDITNLSRNKCYFSALCNPKGRIISSLWICIENLNQINIICPTNLVETLINFFNMRKFRLKIKINQSHNDLVINSNTVRILSTNDNTSNQTSLEQFYDHLFTNNLAWIDAKNTEKFIPQHVNMDQHENIMSFSKGCYPGQEIIARIKYLGKIKKRMKLIESDNKTKLSNQINLRNQVSPIMQVGTGKFSVQVIENVD